MTIERNSGGFGYIASCDHCSHSEDFDEVDSFLEAVNVIKEDGWLISKDEKGEWDHKCPSCRVKNEAKSEL